MFQLSALSNRLAWQRLVNVGVWVGLFALIVVTAVHAISLVIEHAPEGSGVLWVIRVVSPALTELFAALVAIGFAVHYWRADQRILALSIELVWLLFAAMNLVTSFAAEASTAVVTIAEDGTEVVTMVGAALPSFLQGWLNYGLPLSALVTGALLYTVLRLDPEQRREEERAAGEEREAMQLFIAEQRALNSKEMDKIREQKAWLAIVDKLEREGYTPNQIRFMTSHTPQLALVSGGGEAVEEDETAENVFGNLDDLVEELVQERLAERVRGNQSTTPQGQRERVMVGEIVNPEPSLNGHTPNFTERPNPNGRTL